MRAEDEELEAGSLKSLSAEDVVKLATLSVVGRALSTSYNLEEGLRAVLEALMTALDAERGFIKLCEPDGEFGLDISVDKSREPWAGSFNYSRTLLFECASKQQPVLMLDAASESASSSAIAIGTRSVMLHPIVGQSRLRGVLYLDSLLKVGRFRENELKLLGIIADMVSVFLERTFNASALVHKSLELESALIELKAVNTLLIGSAEETVYKLSRAAEFRDDEGGEHVQRVSHYCEQIALRMGFTRQAAAEIKVASQLHDVGKVGIPDSILLKPGRYTEYEREVMKQHTVIGAKILRGSSSPIIRLAEEVALTHHEKWNGTGYPRGLAGDKIPLSGRIVAVADVFDALTTERRYKTAWTVERALELVAKEAGSHFDPQVARVFLELRDKVTEIRDRFQPPPQVEPEEETPADIVLQTRAEGRDWVEPLRKAVELLARGEMLPEKVRGEALHSSRRLTSLLGSLGEGIEAIRRLEGHFRRHDLIPEQAPRLAALLADVERAISEERTEEVTGTGTILLVEPDPQQRESLVIEALNRGLTVIEAKDVASARRAIQVRSPEMIIVEVAQPEGEEFLTWLRLELPLVPLVVLSSEGGFSTRLEVARRGGAIYLQKPLPASTVFDEIEERVGREGDETCNVLALDDDKLILKVITRVVGARGFKVNAISDPLQLWATLAENTPDILLLDLEMPTVNGFDICKVLRSDPHYGHLPIIVLTGHEDNETYQQALEAGADDVICKPLDPSRLVSRIRSRLHRDIALRKSAARDPLTGLMDVRAALRTASHLFALAVRSAAPFSLCVLRVNRFEELVQARGWSKATEVLRLVALVLERRSRTEDLVVHYRDNCFLLGLYGSPREATQKLVESLNARLEQEDFQMPKDEFPVRCTAFTASYPEDGTHLNELLDKVNAVLDVDAVKVAT